MANPTVPVPVRVPKKTGPYTDDEWQTIDDLLRHGLNRAEVARMTGRPTTSIGRRGAKIGVKFDGAATAAATARKQIDNRRLRTEIIEDCHILLAEAITVAKTAVIKKHVTHDGKIINVDLDRPEFRDLSDYGKWLTSLVTIAEKLSKIDSEQKPDGAAVDDFLANQVDNRVRPMSTHVDTEREAV